MQILLVQGANRIELAVYGIDTIQRIADIANENSDVEIRFNYARENDNSYVALTFYGEHADVPSECRQKIAAIKRVRELTGLGLTEAKAFVERWGAYHLTKVRPEEAARHIADFRMWGYRVEKVA